MRPRSPALVVALILLLAAVVRTVAQTDPLPATVEVDETIPAAGSTVRSFAQFEVQFNQAVTGLEAADLLINGVAATNVVEPIEARFLFTFTEPPPGPLTVEWRTGHGIVARDHPAQTFPGGSWNFLLDPAALPASVMISEFMADNRTTLRDEDGDAADWIELYNGTDEAVDLDGWFLTDDPRTPAKWRLPQVFLDPHQYLVLFASGKDRSVLPGRLHTNFKLANSDGYLALLSPATNVVSAFAPTYPPQTTDVSYGRLESDPTTTGYFPKPTPGQPNPGSGAGFAPPVSFSRSSGPFFSPFTLALDVGSTNALIRFTMDGTVPTNTSLVYAGAIGISNSVQVRARAYQDGLMAGPVTSESFIWMSGAVTNFTSDLPVMVLHSLGRGGPNATRPNFTHVAVYEPVGGVTAFTNQPALTTRAGIQIRGSSTEGNPKPAYKLELRDEADQDRHEALLGLPAESDWVLYAPDSFDVPLIHNPFVHQLSRDLGRYSSRTRFVEVFQNRGIGPITSGHYQGIYVVEEKIKVGPQRVAIDPLQPEDTNAPAVTGGYLMKFDRLDPGDSGISGGGTTVGMVDPKERDLRSAARKPQLTYLTSYLTQFGQALNGVNWRDPVLGYRRFIDVDGWIDFHVLEVLSGNVDALVLSTYLYKSRNGPIDFGPHWDFDRALGSTDGRDRNPRVWTTGPFFGAAWWSRLFNDVDFWQKWVDRWQDLRVTHFSLTHLNQLVDDLGGQVRLAQPRDFQKWRVAPRQANGSGIGTYATELQWMKNWLSNRIDFIDRQLTARPTLSAPGGTVSPGFAVSLIIPTNATVYYTLDGRDPRTSLGSVAANAAMYSAGQTILIGRNTRLVARARDLTKKQTGGPPVSTPWSGPVAATFVTDTPTLRLTEIMFHPEAPPADSPFTSSDFEFLEFKNTGATRLDLTGFRLTNGVAYVFGATSAVTQLDPGHYVLLVANLAAFQSRYPGITNIAGQFSGSLRNSGNLLRLVGPLEEPVIDLTYSDSWAPLADGVGFSIVIRDEALAAPQLTDATQWRASAHSGGSPGTADPTATDPPHVVVNEVVSKPAAGTDDAVELYNPGNRVADVSGWWLSDDFRTPKKMRIPSGTLIPAQGFAVFHADSFQAAGFGFRALGDSVWLFSADGDGQLTGWVHGFSFGAQAKGSSFSRQVTTEGREFFEPGSAPTLGAANATPVASPGALLQILYQPPPLNGQDNTRDEYIDVGDVSAADEPVVAFDPEHSTNTWHIRGSVSYDFPPGFRFPASRRVVVVGFDPQRDATATAGFRATYRLDASTILLGPWQGGTLPNDGGVVRLLRPLHPVAAPSPDVGLVPYVLIDEVPYTASQPWPPDANGTGRAIRRSVPTGPGYEPTGWQSWTATPGDDDTDGDGLPDRWEMANGLDPRDAGGINGALSDLDGDHFTNWQEYLAGTSPRDAHDFPQLDVALADLGLVRLEFPSAPSRIYSVQYRTVPDSGDWRTLRRLISPADGGVVTVLDAPTDTARFYRLQIP